MGIFQELCLESLTQVISFLVRGECHCSFTRNLRRPQKISSGCSIVCHGKWSIYRWSMMIYRDFPPKMVIFHSYELVIFFCLRCHVLPRDSKWKRSSSSRAAAPNLETLLKSPRSRRRSCFLWQGDNFYNLYQMEIGTYQGCIIMIIKGTYDNTHYNIIIKIHISNFLWGTYRYLRIHHGCGSTKIDGVKTPNQWPWKSYLALEMIIFEADFR